MIGAVASDTEFGQAWQSTGRARRATSDRVVDEFDKGKKIEANDGIRGNVVVAWHVHRLRVGDGERLGWARETRSRPAARHLERCVSATLRRALSDSLLERYLTRAGSSPVSTAHPDRPGESVSFLASLDSQRIAS